MKCRIDSRSQAGCLVALLSVLAFGTGLFSLGLPDEPDHWGSYDGDGDDVGIVQERSTVASDVAVVHTVVFLAPLLLSHREATPDSPDTPRVPPPGSLASRGPPA